MDNAHFISGDFDTHFVKTHFTDSSVLDNSNEEEAQIAALLAKHLQSENSSQISVEKRSQSSSNWKKNRR